MFRKFSILLFLISSLFSDEYQNDPYISAINKGEPSFIIEGCVNVITGDLHFFKQDAVVKGREPIEIPRIYITRNNDNKECGWSFFPYILAFYQKEGPSLAIIPEKDGTYLEYEYYKTNNKKEKELRVKKESYEFGITNARFSQISGRINVKNNRVITDKKRSYLRVLSPDGGWRYYRWVKRRDGSKDAKKYPKYPLNSYYFILKEELLPNGNYVVYEYDKFNRVTSISTLNRHRTKCYAWAKFTYRGKNTKEGDYVIETSDGQRIEYIYQRHERNKKHKGRKRAFYLESAKNMYSPDEYYEYILEGKMGEVIKKINLPDGRGAKVDYYNKGFNKVHNTLVKVPKRKDLKYKRVKALYLPLGENGEYKKAYEFIYHPGKLKETSGITEVFDINGNKTTYHYSKYLRPTKIERYYKKGNIFVLKNMEKLIWGNENSEKATLLLGKGIFDHNGKAIFFKRFFYDDRGNVIKERIYGSITGEKKVEIKFDSNGLPLKEGTEYSEIIKTYTNDNTNRILSKEDENQLKENYFYFEKFNILSKTLVTYKNIVKLRKFFFYDSDLNLIQEVVDNGINYKYKDMHNVTERKITKYKNIKNGNFCGLPYEIEEFYLEKKTNKEVRLNRRVLHYSSKGFVEKEDVYDSNNNYVYSIHKNYDNKGRIIKEVNEVGQKALYGYDRNNNQTFFQDYHGRIKKYIDYDFYNRPIKIVEKGDDNITHLTFFKYDLKSNLIEKKDFLENITKYKYDEFGNLLEIIYPQTERTASTKYIYDDIGRVITEIDGKERKLKTYYNIHNNPIKKIFPDKTEEKFIYNLDGTLKMQIDPENVQTIYSYDFFKRKTEKRIIASPMIFKREATIYNAFHKITFIDAANNQYTYHYDEAGRIKEEYFNEKKEKSYFYDSLNRVIKIKTNDLYYIIYKKDNLGRIIEERMEDEDEKIYFLKSYGYDSFGNKNSITNNIEGKNYTEEFLYDSFNRLIQKKDALKNISKIIYQENFKNNFDQNVIKKIEIDPSGLKNIFILDALQREEKIEIRASNDKLLKETTFFYDEADNLIKEIYSTADNETIIEKKYNEINKLIELKEEDKITKYSYTGQGLLKETIKPDGTIITNSYDGLGRKIYLKSSDNMIDYCYRYDPLDHLIEGKNLITGNSTIIIRDKKGNIIKEQLENDLTIENSYDDLGRKTKMVFPDNSLVEYEYDALNLKKIVRKDQFNNNLYEHKFEKYDLSGNCLLQKMIDGSDMKSSFDPLNREKKIYSPYFYQEIKKFDTTGNIKKVDYNGTIANYEYDDLHQLIKEEGIFSNDYSFDANQNITKKNGKKFKINKINQIVSTYEEDYQYDKNGNLISVEDTSNYIHYSYDSLDRLIKVENKNLILTYKYDVLNRRISKLCYKKSKLKRGYKNIFLYDENKEIGIYDTEKNVLSLRILNIEKSSEKKGSIALELNSKVYLPINDLYGNVVCLVSNKAIKESYRFTAFGEEIIYSNRGRRTSYSYLNNPWRYLSKYTEETGLVFFGRRYYDPRSARWISCDPEGFASGSNLYVFLINNPFIYSDPFGLSVEFNVDLKDMKISFLNYMNSKYVREQYAKDEAYLNTITSVARENVRQGEPSNYASMWLFRPRYDKSSTFSLGDNVALNSVGFVNGINTSVNDAIKEGQYIKSLSNNKMTDMNISYNSSGGFFHDLGEVFFKDLRELETKSVIDLYSKWMHFFRNTPPDMPYLQFCHSQGAIKVANAIKLLPDEYKKRLTVVAIAPAMIIKKEWGVNCFNYVSKNDWISRTMTLKDRKLSEVTFLEPHAKASWLFDHSFLSVTYTKPIKDHLSDHFKKVEEIRRRQR